MTAFVPVPIWQSLKSSTSDPVRSSVTVAVSGLVSFVSIAWLSVGWWYQVNTVIMLAAIQFTGSVVSARWVLRGHVTLGRVAWFISTLFVVACATLSVPLEGRVEQMFFPLVSGIFLHCSFKHEKRLILQLVSICFAVWSFVQLTGPGFFFYPIVTPDFAQYYIAPLSSWTTMLMCAVHVALFAFLGERHEDILESERNQAQQANALKSEFLAAMSHEIRTPMNGVVGMAEVLATTDMSASQRRSLSIIQDSGNALLRIIDDILDISSVEAGKLVMQREAVDLEAVLDGSIDALRAYANKNGVEMHYDIAGPLPRLVHADDGRLRQIIINLLSNAIKFTAKVTEDRAKVATLSVFYTKGKELKIAVSDTGIGMPPDFLLRLFEPFGRSEVARRAKIGGTGLGLTIVKKLVDMMGGQIVVTSEVGKGTTVALNLPLHVLVEPEPRTQVAAVSLRLVGMSDRQVTLWTTICREYGIACSRVDLNDMDAHFAEGFRHYIDIFGTYDAQTLEDVLAVRHSRLDPSLSRQFIFENPDPEAWTTWLDNGVCLLQAAPLLPSEARHALEQVLSLRSRTIAGDDPAPKPAEAPTLAKLRVLVADDDATNRMVLEQKLRLLGIDPIMVEDGVLALNLLRESKFDLLLTDCQMPNMDGFELTAAVRMLEQRSGTSALPIIAITANALKGEGDRCREAGMTDYLAKPVRSAELKRIIARYVPGAGGIFN